MKFGVRKRGGAVKRSFSLTLSTACGTQLLVPALPQHTYQSGVPRGGE